MKYSKKPKSARAPITTGQLNRIVDTLIHAFFQKDERYIWFDGFVHALIEQDLRVSAEKFVKYNVPILLKRKPARKAHRRKRNCLTGG